MNGWQDLSDEELAARLLQRGVDFETVDIVIGDREDEFAIGYISTILRENS